MAKYGLSPGTLKGELFSVLLNHGNNGLKVSELTKIPSVSQCGKNFNPGKDE